MRLLAWLLVLVVALLACLAAGPLAGLSVAVLLAASLAPVDRRLLAVNPALANYNADSPAGQTVAVGAQDVTIPSTTGSTVWTCEEFNFTYFDSDWTELNNSATVPSKQFGKEKVPTCEIQLQHAGGAPNLPNKFANFSAVAENGVSYTFIIARINTVSKNDGTPKAISVTARYRLNA